jgi:hypothetical protein
MATIDEILQEFPKPVQLIIQPIWANLPGEQRKELEVLLEQLPLTLPSIQDILLFVLDQYGPVLGTKRNIAILGPANVGKSTLYNQLVFCQEDKAQVGPIPGTTRQNQEADTGLFTLIDTPGADAVGEVGQREREIAFEAAKNADFLVGVPGRILSAAIAAATTVAIGYAAMVWFAHNEKMTQESMRKIVADVTRHLKDQLVGLGKEPEWLPL